MTPPPVNPRLIGTQYKASRRSRRALSIFGGLLLLGLLAFLIWFAGRPRPAPAAVPVAPAAQASTAPALRPPTLIVTAPPTASPLMAAGDGKG